MVASQVAQRVSGLSIEQMGGIGFTRELGIEKYWRYEFPLRRLLTEIVIRRLELFTKAQYQGRLN